MQKTPKYDHIVMISIDTLRSDALAGHPAPLWPDLYPNLSAPATDALTRLSGDGHWFTNCVSAAPYTSASHASILSGKWPQRHGVYEFFNRKLSANTIFTRARRQGIPTIMKSDFPYILGPTLGFDRDIDNFIIENDNAFLKTLGSLKKSCSLVHFGGVHVPYGFHNLHYGAAAYRDRVRQLEDDLGAPADLPKDQLFETKREGEDLQYLMRYKRIIQELWQAGRAEEIFGLYLEGIEHFLTTRFTPFLDRLLETLKGQRTLIVLFGDHGEEYSPDAFGHFNAVTEGVMRVPLIFHGPDVPKGTTQDRVRTVDILPTIYDLAEDRATRRLAIDGESLLPRMRGLQEGPCGPAFAQAWVADTARFVRFQQQMLTKGTKRGSLPHLLYREVVWSGDYRLTRQCADFNTYLGGLAQIDPVLTLERFDNAHRPQPHTDVRIELEMSRLLEQYNGLSAAQKES